MTAAAIRAVVVGIDARRQEHRPRAEAVREGDVLHQSVVRFFCDADDLTSTVGRARRHFNGVSQAGNLEPPIERDGLAKLESDFLSMTS